MKISLLIEREDFKEIFKNSLMGFLEDFTDKKHVVNWYSKREEIPEKNFQKWYCNPLINSIYIDGANKQIFDPITQEYSHNPLKPWRSYLQKSYLHISKSKYFSKLLAKYIITISPKIDNAENILIIGGNTKIRLIDRKAKKVYAILKQGFDKIYIERELYVKSNFSFLTVPEIYSIGKNRKWYCEEYLSGTSPDRMNDSQGFNILNDAIKNLQRIQTETKKTEPLFDYVHRLEMEIKQSIDQEKYFNQKLKNKVEILISIVKRHLQSKNSIPIVLSYCHGDFQQGNIIFDGSKTWIIDWEYSGYKQRDYDLFVLLLKSRVSKDFSTRFLKLYKGELNKFHKLIINIWPSKDLVKAKERKFFLVLFLLEELNFHVTENANIMFKKQSKGLEDFLFSLNIISKRL